MNARFSGYVLKECSFNQLLDAIRAVGNGQMYLCPQVVGAVVASYLGLAVGWYRAGEGAGFLGAVVGAVIILALYNAMARRNAGPV